MTIFQTLKLIWKRFWRRHKVDKIVVLESMADLPKRLRHDLYVVGDPNPKWAILACPWAAASVSTSVFGAARKPLGILK